MTTSEFAGQPADPSMLVDLDALRDAYYDLRTDPAEPTRAASFLQGFLQVNALALVKSRAVVTALDAFLARIDKARFRDALPVLRRAFVTLGATERRYLLENVLSVQRATERAKAGESVLAERDRDKLRAMSGDLAKAMEDLDDLL